jgi:hypothetical protein
MPDGHEGPGKQFQENVRRQAGWGKESWCRLSAGLGFSQTRSYQTRSYQTRSYQTRSYQTRSYQTRSYQTRSYQTRSCKTSFWFDAGNDVSCFRQHSLQVDGQFLAFVGGLPKPDWKDHRLRFPLHAAWAGMTRAGWLAKDAL